MTSLIILQIPENIPTPRFRLFQEVMFSDHARQGKGRIVGLSWMTNIPPQADIKPGWIYQIDIDSPDTELAIYCLESEISLP